MDYESARKQLEQIFRAGLRRVDPYRMMHEHVTLSGSRLTIDLETGRTTIDLDEFERIFVIGAGKATAPMARATEELLGERIESGLIVVKYDHTEELEIIETMEAGHPVPDDNGMAAARRILALADKADGKDLLIGLISGGGSALLTLPAQWRHQAGAAIRLEDKQRTTRVLLACGAGIEEINCVRKHLSEVKGGRLLEHIAPARSLNFILSDVVGDDLSSIASGITVPDPTTYADALAIIEKYDIADKVPGNVRRVLKLGADGQIPETLKAGDPAAALAVNLLIGSNRSALQAAAAEARRLGYEPVLLTSRISGEARETARVLSAVAVDAATQGLLAKGPACIISGGEPVVTLQGAGKGGRNQEMALAFLLEMARAPDLNERICFLAGATDGNDGPTDAAGAFADIALLNESRKQGLRLRDFLKANDAYHFFEVVGGLLKTGPTNTNVCDLHMILIGAGGPGR